MIALIAAGVIGYMAGVLAVAHLVAARVEPIAYRSAPIPDEQDWEDGL